MVLQTVWTVIDEHIWGITGDDLYCILLKYGIYDKYLFHGTHFCALK